MAKDIRVVAVEREDREQHVRLYVLALIELARQLIADEGRPAGEKSGVSS